MEQIVFPIPQECEYLTDETKQKIYNSAPRDEQGSKVPYFFTRHEDMFAEMNWQKKLRCKQPRLPETAHRPVMPLFRFKYAEKYVFPFKESRLFARRSFQEPLEQPQLHKLLLTARVAPYQKSKRSEELFCQWVPV